MDLFDIVIAKKLTGGGGGGGGSSDFSTATVTATYTFPEDLESAEGMHISLAQLYSVTDAFGLAITWNYEEDSMPISELGTPSQMSIPIYNPYSTEISQISYEVPGEGSLQIDVDNTNVVSGDAMKYSGGIFVYGDCTLDITLVWP